MEFLAEFSTNPAFFPILTGIVCVALWAALTLASRDFSQSIPPVAEMLRSARNFLLPVAALFYYLIFVAHFSLSAPLLKFVESALGVALIWTALSLVKVFFFSRAGDATWRARVPSLFVDIIRVALVVIGGGVVFAVVWNKDLGALLATLGVGSIVIGLALQDTLGNLVAGIALVFERPFEDGDWVQVGDITGKVLEQNWRAVRICTRQLDQVVIPNSVLAKERFTNFSRPSPTHVHALEIGFAYSDPPNRVRHMLISVALDTAGVRKEPAPQARAIRFNSSSIDYQIRLFIDDFERVPEIEDEFLTQVWYAARRNQLTIPFPIRTVYKTEVPPEPPRDVLPTVVASLQACELFGSLDANELDILARDIEVQVYAHGETIVRKGEHDSRLFIIKRGSVAVTLERNSPPIAVLQKNDYFGEIGVLTGEPRTADVIAKEDLELLIVYKESLHTLLQRRADLADRLAKVVEQRKEGLASAPTATVELATASPSGQRTRALADRIRGFLRRL